MTNSAVAVGSSVTSASMSRPTIAPRMAAQDWLGSYREFAVLREVLGGMSRRLSRPHLLDGSWEELAQRYDDLSADFRAFYPQLQAFALSQR